MAYGEHWEWRGFGHIPPDLQARIEALPLAGSVGNRPEPAGDEPESAGDEPGRAGDRPAALGSEAGWLDDCYLWVPHCTVNVKLRCQDLKLKRFLRAEQGLECWLEDPTEIFPLPLTVDVVAKVASALAVTLPALPAHPVGRGELLTLLRRATPSVQAITVRKRRRFYALAVPNQPLAVLVELTIIVRPEPITTLALEHPDLAALRVGLTTLHVDQAPLRPLNYLQALAVWARGQRI